MQLIKSLSIPSISLFLFLPQIVYGGVIAIQVGGTSSAAMTNVWDCPPYPPAGGGVYSCTTTSLLDESTSNIQTSASVSAGIGDTVSQAQTNYGVNKASIKIDALDEGSTFPLPPTGVANTHAMSAWGDIFVISGGTGNGVAAVNLSLDGHYWAEQNFAIDWFLDDDYDLRDPYYNATPLSNLFSDSCSIFSCSTGVALTTIAEFVTYEFEFEYDVPFVLQSILKMSLGGFDSSTGEIDLFNTAVLSEFILPANSSLTAEFGTYNVRNQVAEPATLALVGLGLAGIGFARKKKQS